MDFDLLAQQILVALRGRRSQVQWSRRLGYKSNVAYAWESGRRSPTASETFRAATRTGIDLDAAIVRFYGAQPSWLDETDPTSPEACARILDDLRGDTPVTELARRAGLSRFSVTRWLSGQTQPKLPDFLRVVEAASLRTVDLVASLVHPESIPIIAPIWGQLEARRRGAFELPWTQGVLRALELEGYRALPEHQPGWIAARLGISVEEETRCLEFLSETGQIERGTHWVEGEVRAVDTRRHPEIGRRVKQHWSRVAQDRIEAGAPGQFSYNVFTVSRADFERIRKMHLAYFHALRAVVADSTDDEVVCVANVQLFPLEPDDAG
ncbi:MAG: DUF4423 domain-containing protein [Proteobacteria bacterium]|nr:DUF4423 domain-containing protein [Pseudomonadota bacterium]MCP4916753.1 DUF4423 domain-containing protein [Pseudomonadota bacterium]